MSGNQADLKQLRHDVALANRIIERFGLSGAFGHASARIPGTNTFLLPTRRSPGLAHEDTLLVLDTDEQGQVVTAADPEERRKRTTFSAADKRNNMKQVCAHCHHRVELKQKHQNWGHKRSPADSREPN